VMYDRFIARGVAAPEWFHRATGLSFVARTFVWDVEGYFGCLRGPPLGVGSYRAQEGSPEKELLESIVHHYGGRFVG
jgi:hypothetical protein